MIDRPRIAIPEPTSTDEAYNQRSLPQYVNAIEAGGGIAVTIHLGKPLEEQKSALATCQGILLPGSPADVDPARYGQTRIEACAAKDAAREAMDDLLLNHAWQEHKPVLGICFGLQSLNVWRHGTLIQDLAQSDLAVRIDHEPGREVVDAHSVTVTPETRLASLLAAAENGDESERVSVNSSHHQAVATPGDHLQVAARSAKDGVIEALESSDPERFLLAVQWHPERTYQQSAESRAIFSGFLKAASAWRQPAETVPPR